jgi:biopolymer transport protein ExbB
MLWLTDAIEAIRDFMNLGGPVLRMIAFTIFLMWVLIVERILYFRTTMKSMSKEIHDEWESRSERRSWNAQQIRELMEWSEPFPGFSWLRCLAAVQHVKSSSLRTH